MKYSEYVCTECEAHLISVMGDPYCPECDNWVDELEDENGDIVWPVETAEP